MGCCLKKKSDPYEDVDPETEHNQPGHQSTEGHNQTRPKQARFTDPLREKLIPNPDIRSHNVVVENNPSPIQNDVAVDKEPSPIRNFPLGDQNMAVQLADFDPEVSSEDEHHSPAKVSKAHFIRDKNQATQTGDQQRPPAQSPEETLIRQQTPLITIDMGSCRIRAAIYGPYNQKVSFPSIIGNPKHRDSFNSNLINGKKSVGNMAYGQRGNLTIEYPIQNGEISRCDDSLELL
jgi:actin-related protein